MKPAQSQFGNSLPTLQKCPKAVLGSRDPLKPPQPWSPQLWGAGAALQELPTPALGQGSAFQPPALLPSPSEHDPELGDAGI